MVLQILLWLSVTLLALVGLLVCLPVYVAVQWQSDPVGRSVVLLRPLGGASPMIRVYDSTRQRTVKRAARKMPKAHKGGLAPHGNVVAEMVTLLRRIRDAIRFDVLQLDAEFGLGDPAETGQAFGQLCPLIYGSGANLRLRPNFDVACMHGNATAQLRVTPIAVAWPVVVFAWRLFGPGR